LPYLSFGVFVLGILTFFAIFPITLIVSYFLSGGDRVCEGARHRTGHGAKVVTVSAGDDRERGALHRSCRVAGDFRTTGLSRSRGSAGSRCGRSRSISKAKGGRSEVARLGPVAPEWAPTAAGLFVGVGSLALWWTLLGVVGSTYPGAVRAVFYPLCNRLESRHGVWLAMVCGAVLIPWSFATYEVVAALVSR